MRITIYHANGKENPNPLLANTPKTINLMRSVICVHERFDADWPFAADYWQECWKSEGCELYRTEEPDALAPQLVPNPDSVQRLVLLGLPAGSDDLAPFTALEECFHSAYRVVAKSGLDEAAARGVHVVPNRHELFWGQSVSEYGLALTLGGLRRIPQLYDAMKQSHGPWKYRPEVGRPGHRGGQFGDDSRFSSGTLGGKRVRVVGAGNIGARYASFCVAIGADVAVWDPFAPDATFAASGATRCFHLSELVKDAEVFVPMLPLKEDTRGLIGKDLIEALPHGCLVVQVTRALICDTEALYRRVLNDELALAADVFDIEPVPLDSPLLGRHNVVHTPHNAGRTFDANRAWVDDKVARFKPRP